MKFTPEVLLSAPRRSAGVPNALGTKVLHTTSTYSFKTHSKETTLNLIDVISGDSHVLARDEDVSDFNWLDDAGKSMWKCSPACERGVSVATLTVVASSSSTCVRRRQLLSGYSTEGDSVLRGTAGEEATTVAVKPFSARP